MTADESRTLIPAEGAGSQTSEDERAETGPELARGDFVDRYVVVERIGEGAMGVVYAAFDPDLGRKVALKLLRAGPASDPRAHARLLREAQAMARLNHRNVVTVHDVGFHDDQIFLAMEYVQGLTLKHWQAQERRSWSAVLAVYRRAGAGLAAAHESGVIHRDFKPENVMVSPSPAGAEGVRVMDFGLARDGEAATADPEGGLTSADGMPTGLTQTGVVVGTPAYMAPEQFGGHSDQLSDQFSFCASLYEGLYGARPFAGDTLAELVGNVKAGAVEPPATDPRVPRWLRAVVVRGLDPDPGRRFESMAALLAALGRNPARRWWRLGLLGGGAVVALGAAAASALVPTPGERMCSRGAEKVAAVWNEERSERVADAFGAVDMPHATPTWLVTSPVLSSYADGWVVAYQEACEATHVRGERSAQRLDASMACLQEQLARFDALVDEFESVDAALIERALQAATALPDAGACEQPRRGPQTLHDPSARSQLAEAQRHLAAAKARNDAGRYAAGIEAADAALQTLGELDVAVVRAEALLVRGQLERLVGNYEPAESTQREALRVATPAGAHDIVAEAWLELVFNIAAVQKDPTRAAPALFAAELAVQASGERRFEMRWNDIAALTSAAAGDQAQARQYAQRALELADELDAGPAVREVLHNNYSHLLFDMGRYREALVQSEASMEHAMALRGDDHPHVAQNLHNLARIHKVMGDYESARTIYHRSLAIREAALGPDHQEVGDTLLNLAVLESSQTNWDKARTLATRALEIYEQRLPPDHPYIAIAHNNLGTFDESQNRLESALQHYRKAVELSRARWGDGHQSAAAPLNNIGLVHLKLEDYEAALESLRRALSIEEKALGPEHPKLAFQLVGMARAELARGQPREAVVLAQRARRVREAAGAEPAQMSLTYLTLARALKASGAQGDAVREAAQRALETWRETGLSDPDRVRKLEALIAGSR